MINYSSINDAWGNNSMYKKNIHETIDIITPPQIDTNIPIINNIINNLPKVNLPEVNLPEVNLPEVNLPKVNLPEANNLEHFSDTINNCNISEHLKNCEDCRNKILELFSDSNNDYSEINLFNYKFSIKKDILKIIFIGLIIIIFFILLSLINISFKTSQMKYFMLPNMNQNSHYMNYMNYMNSIL